MKLKAKHVLLGATTGWLLGGSASAFVAPTYTTSFKSNLSFMIGQRVLRPDTGRAQTEAMGHEKSALEGLSVRRDLVSGQARVISGRFGLSPIAVSAGAQAFVDAALSFIDDNTDTFGVSSRDLQVADGATHLGADEQFVRFHVYRDGLRIADAGIDFRFKRGHLVQIVNQSFAEASAPKGAAQSVEQLQNRVAAETFADKIEAAGNHLRVETSEEGKAYQLVQVASFRVQSELGDLTAEADAATGKLFEVRDNHFHYGVDVKADAHPRWYNDSPRTLTLQDIAVQTDNGDVFPTFAASDVTNPRLEGLSGRFVKIDNQSGTDIAQSGELVNGRWQIHVKSAEQGSAWLDKTMAQIMVYVHTNTINRKAKEYISSPWLDRPLQANTNLSRTCNAHWDGSTINLYSGNDQCANTGLIADVIYHEWGHGLDAKTGGIDDGAFSEGFGDILALAMTRSPMLGIGFRVSNHGPVRDLEPNKVYPDDRGEVHAEGLIIASTFWDLFKALRDKYNEDTAAEMIARYAFKMILTARTYLDVYDALKVIDDNDTNPANGTPNLCLINEVFAQHGLAEREDSCKLAAIDAYQIQDDDADEVIEPGENVQVFARARNASSQDLTGLSGSLSISAGSGVQVTSPTLSWETIAAGSSAMSQEGAQLSIDSSAVCGSSFTTKLALSANGAETSVLKTFVIGKNVGTAHDFAATGLPIAIVDRSTVHAKLAATGEQWADATPVAAARLQFSIRHTYVGDLIVRLVSPSGKEFEVYRGRGTGNDVTFDSDVSEIVKGQAGKGTWTLAVQDKARRDSGFLDSFALTLTPAAYVCD